MYVFVSSDDCKDIYPNNAIVQFSVELPREIDSEHYQVALTHVYFKSRVIKGTYNIVYCDIVQESFINGECASVLGCFFQPGGFDQPIYLDLKPGLIKRLHFRITSTNGPLLEDIDKAIFFTLHFKEKNEKSNLSVDSF